MIKSTRFDVIAPDDKYRDVIDSIRLYRHICRQLFSASALAEIAGGSIGYSEKNDERFLTVSPNRDLARNLLQNVYGGRHSNHLYELRNFVRSELAPGFLSFVWDSARRDVSSRWLARDPELNATRGWLTIQGARGLAFFNRIGIGCPMATARPSFYDHNISLKFDQFVGYVEFKISKLDNGRYIIWKSLRDNVEGWKPGTMYLNERDGKIFITISYERPDPPAAINKSRVMNIVFNTDEPEFFITSSCSEGRYSAERISVVDAVSWLSRLEQVKFRYERQLAALGNQKKYRSVVTGRMNKLTKRRTDGQTGFNHLWTRRLVDYAVRCGCGTIAVKNLPERVLVNHPWAWSQFINFLRYKIEQLNGELKI